MAETVKSLKPFRAKKVCEKCGSKDVHRAYIPKEEATSYHRGFGDDGCKVEQEHHDLYCRGCGHRWAERVK